MNEKKVRDCRAKRASHEGGMNKNKTNPVLIVIRNHDEQIHGISRQVALGHEHVLRPSASAEIEFVESLKIRAAGSVAIQIAERSLERYGQGRFQRASSNCILSPSHCDRGFYFTNLVIHIKKFYSRVVVNLSISTINILCSLKV